MKNTPTYKSHREWEMKYKRKNINIRFDAHGWGYSNGYWSIEFKPNSKGTEDYHYAAVLKISGQYSEDRTSVTNINIVLVGRGHTWETSFGRPNNPKLGPTIKRQTTESYKLAEMDDAQILDVTLMDREALELLIDTVMSPKNISIHDAWAKAERLKSEDFTRRLDLFNAEFSDVDNRNVLESKPIPYTYAGRLKMYNEEKGYGFITPNVHSHYSGAYCQDIDWKKDIFFHISDVEGGDIHAEGHWELLFDIAETDRGFKCINVTTRYEYFSRRYAPIALEILKMYNAKLDKAATADADIAKRILENVHYFTRRDNSNSVTLTPIEGQSYSSSIPFKHMDELNALRDRVEKLKAQQDDK